MLKLWKKYNKQTKVLEIRSLAKSQLDKNREVFNSLKDYDEGKKEISTTHVREHLRDLQPSS